jgi:hypothetical protein
MDIGWGDGDLNCGAGLQMGHVYGQTWPNQQDFSILRAPKNGRHAHNASF